MAIPGHLKSALLTAFVLWTAIAAVIADSSGQDGRCPANERTSGPKISNSLITSYISVDGGGIVNCNMQYSAPMTATLYQGMVRASQQHWSDFEFTSQLYPPWGHFIDSINGVEPMDDFYWLLFDRTNLMTTSVGVDGITLVENSTYIWHYTNNYNMIYSGPCEGSSIITPFTYNVAYLSVTTSNASQVHVCKKVILIPASPAITTVYGLLESANDQIPVDIQAVLNMPGNTVTSFNGVANDETYTWKGYSAPSNQQIPLDLSMTTVSDGDHIEFRFMENDQ